jgi:hypothetical protein
MLDMRKVRDGLPGSGLMVRSLGDRSANRGARAPRNCVVMHRRLSEDVDAVPHAGLVRSGSPYRWARPVSTALAPQRQRRGDVADAAEAGVDQDLQPSSTAALSAPVPVVTTR